MRGELGVTVVLASWSDSLQLRRASPTAHWSGAALLTIIMMLATALESVGVGIRVILVPGPTVTLRSEGSGLCCGPAAGPSEHFYHQ